MLLVCFLDPIFELLSDILDYLCLLKRLSLHIFGNLLVQSTNLLKMSPNFLNLNFLSFPAIVDSALNELDVALIRLMLFLFFDDGVGSDLLQFIRDIVYEFLIHILNNGNTNL